MKRRAKRKMVQQADRCVHAQHTTKPLPPVARDPLLGSPLVADRPTIVLQRAGPHDLPIPTRLHHAIPERGSSTPERMGSFVWTAAFRRRLLWSEEQGTAQEQYRRRIWHRWWEPEWAEREMRAQFAANIVDAVLEYVRDGGDLHEIARRYGHTETWVVQRERAIRKHIRSLQPQYAS